MTATVNTDGTEGSPEVGASESGRLVSEAKARANAYNACHSTGPRTEAGKRRSAMNALTHGAFARTPVAIYGGTFAEDSDDLDAFIDGIVESLEPRDVLEADQALRIAMCSVRSARLYRLEAAVLSQPQHLDSVDPYRLGGSCLEEQFEKALCIEIWLALREDPGVDFEDLLPVLVEHSAQHLTAGTDGFEPEPDENQSLPAKERVQWFVDHYPDPPALSTWARGQTQHYAREMVARDTARSESARLALADAERVSVTSQRNSRELDQALRRYDVLRKRPLQAAA